ncbi:MAG: hypothetical protein G01um101448_702 [Parcubacteria group bacterium Gr01-1014_48]|nr:MAG: hypothetical protein G01um101448_702 [Parcubacteria group bacterium Gr01-1014_48]
MRLEKKKSLTWGHKDGRQIFLFPEDDFSEFKKWCFKEAGNSPLNIFFILSWTHVGTEKKPSWSCAANPNSCEQSCRMIDFCEDEKEYLAHLKFVELENRISYGWSCLQFSDSEGCIEIDHEFGGCNDRLKLFMQRVCRKFKMKRIQDEMGTEFKV